MNESIRILLAQKEKRNAELLSDILEKNGYSNIFTAFDGIDTMRDFEKYTPDVIFMDPSISLLDGNAVLKKVKSARPDCIVAITPSDYNKAEAEEYIKNGSDGYLTEFQSENRVIPWLIVSLAAKERNCKLKEEYHRVSTFLDSRLCYEKVIGKFASDHSLSFEEAEKQIIQISESKEIPIEKLIEIMK